MCSQRKLAELIETLQFLHTHVMYSHRYKDTRFFKKTAQEYNSNKSLNELNEVQRGVLTKKAHRNLTIPPHTCNIFSQIQRYTFLQISVLTLTFNSVISPRGGHIDRHFVKWITKIL